MNIDLEFNGQMLMFGINYNTSTTLTTHYSTWEFYFLFFRLIVEFPTKL